MLVQEKSYTLPNAKAYTENPVTFHLASFN